MRSSSVRPPVPATPLGTLTRHTLLSARKEQALARQARSGDRIARNTLIECNVRLVYKIASGYLRAGLELDDLVQEGIVGLARAVDKFDPDRGTRLSTYATWWIKQAITRAHAQSRATRLPIHAHDRAQALARTIQDLTVKLGRVPTVAERAQALGLSVDQVTTIDQVDGGATSLQTPVGDGQAALEDFIADNTDVSEIVEERALNQVVHEMLDHLSPREQRIIKLRFGFDGCEPQTLTDIAVTLGISHERARQIEQLAIRKLRKHANGRGLGPDGTGTAA
ncbi:MAG TPA: RNA polymerase sigma factor RpoD/SigA [bacterium]|nr:RNA polymerase sigma factor RpoD/SigA [bacterium]